MQIKNFVLGISQAFLEPQHVSNAVIPNWGAVECRKEVSRVPPNLELLPFLLMFYLIECRKECPKQNEYKLFAARESLCLHLEKILQQRLHKIATKDTSAVSENFLCLIQVCILVT